MALQSLPLPSKPTTYEIWREDRPQYLSAYNLAFNAEKYATQQAEADPSNNLRAKDNIISARVAGYILVEFFNRRAILTEGPCRYLSIELNRDDGDANDAVFNVGKFHRNHFLRLFRSTNDSTTRCPSPSSRPTLSRPSFDTVENMNMDYMMADDKSYRTARRKVFSRDCYRCLLTGTFDAKSMQKDRELGEMCTRLVAAATVIAV